VVRESIERDHAGGAGSQKMTAIHSTS